MSSEIVPSMTEEYQAAEQRQRFNYLGHRFAVLSATAVAALGANGTMRTPASAYADGCSTTQEGNTTTTTCTTTTEDGYTTTTTTTTNEGENDLPTPPTAPGEPAPSGSAEPKKPVTRPSFVDYNQNDGQWGARIAASGCGPTSIAMVVATLTGKRVITPITIGRKLGDKYYIPGSGTRREAFPVIARMYGLEEHRVGSLRAAARVIKLGGLAIVHAKKGHFTTPGHYMVLKSYINDKFQIADPNARPGRDSETRSWSAMALRRAGVDEFYTFQK
ncbi:MAG: murein hydrolase [Candidatus Saccharibacteria bacterium]|nr:murein hydrolase [Candidatus Saccharibacteria bacterium]